MKKLVLSIFLFSIAFISYGQDKSKSKTPTAAVTYVSAKAKIEKYHTLEELKQLGKLELTDLYMQRIAVITELIPYLALHFKPGATLKEMGIPETPMNIEHMEKEVKNKDTYLTAVKSSLDDIIPYADKGNIIWSILFFEDIIKKCEEGWKQ